MRADLFDEFAELDIDMPRRTYCDECRRRTMFRYDQFGLPVCLEHQDDDEFEREV